MGKMRHSEGSEVDMTPMIDVVFQLIIFFIVTINMEQSYDPNIKLEFAKNGPVYKDPPKTTLTIEVNRFGWMSLHGAQVTKSQLRDILRHRYNRYGQYPVLIRADARAKHKDVKTVMDLCTETGMWKISFAAVKEKKT